MATAVIMPKAGMSMETGTVVRWLKAVGDEVRAGEPLLEITTDKVDMEVEAETSGVLLAIVHGEGDQVPVTEPIGWVGDRSELGRPLPAGAASQMVLAAPASTPPLQPQPTAGGAAPAAPGSARSVASTPAARRRAAELGIPLSEVAPTGAAGEIKLRDVVEHGRAAQVRASPLARQLAAEQHVDLASVSGRGPGGRVQRADVEAVAHPRSLEARMETAAPAAGGEPGGELIPVAAMRKVIARRLSESMFSAPHYYLRLAVGGERLLAARNAAAAPGGRKPSLNAFLVKYVAEALARHPQLNASWRGDAILRFRTVDIGLAVALPDGLITPVVRDCAAKGVVAIDGELQELIAKARRGKLTPAEYEGATFTISNLGSFGVDEFTAIVNPPGCAILAVGAFRREPGLDESGAVVARTRAQLTLSCDHRAVDGAVGARFLRFLGDILEDPARLLL